MSPTLFATPTRRVSQTSRSNGAGEVHTLLSTSSSSSPARIDPPSPGTSFLRVLLSPLHPSSSASRRKRERPRSTDTATTATSSPPSTPDPTEPSLVPERPKSWESEIEEWEEARRRRGSPVVAEVGEAKVGLDARLAKTASPTPDVSPRSARGEAEAEAGKRRKMVVPVQVGRDGMTGRQIAQIHHAHSLRSEALFALSSAARAGLLKEAAEFLFEAYNPHPRVEGTLELSEQHLADALGFVGREFEREGVGEGEMEVVVKGVEEDGWVEGLKRAGFDVEMLEDEDGAEVVRVRRRVDG